MKFVKLSRSLTLGICISALGSFLIPTAGASVTLIDKDQWRVLFGGFVETDAISDSSRSFAETIGNSPVTSDTVGRTQFSIRNSRLSFTVEAPEAENWKSKGYFEFDLLGNNPSPGASNTEAGFFNNPTFRVRHAYLQSEKDGWLFLAGQTWMLFGWQPYYFMPTLQVAPVTGMLYGRTTQFRAQKTYSMEDHSTVQAAIGLMRPPQRDASMPGIEGGLRYAFAGRTSGFAGGSTAARTAQPMSIGVSGAYREFAIPSGTSDPTSPPIHFPGYGVAVDALLPVLASSDNKDVSNTLSLGGEFTLGKGDGDEFSGWTGGLPSPLNSAAAAPEHNVNLDAGIGGFNSTTNTFSLVKLQTFNAFVQYHLPAQSQTWFSAGYGQLTSSNIYGMRPSTSVHGAYGKEETSFVNIMHQCTPQIRTGFEYAYTRTQYSDGLWEHNSRYQVSAFFLF